MDIEDMRGIVMSRRPALKRTGGIALTSRAAEGTPLHTRMDGPGFSGLDVPAFKTSESFRQMRVRFITATRRQNFLVPPRRNRAFPLVELA